MTDTIFLRDLRVETVIGIWDWERKIRQTVSIDLELAADIRQAAATDSIDDALNYKAVAKRVQQFVGESNFQLVETLAEKIATLILDEFPVPSVQVRINKPGAIRGARDVGVLIRRSKHGDSKHEDSKHEDSKHED
jgi:dihydroneopterin aldolase